MALSAVICLLALALLTVADVGGRYLFARPIPGFADINAQATAIIVAAFIPVVILRRENIALRPFSAFGSERLARATDIFASLLTTAFFALMAWEFIAYAAESLRSGEKTTILRWPVGLSWSVVAAMSVLSAIAAATVFVADVQNRRGRDE